MNISLFDYKLPPELIAQSPASPRDQSRLTIINRKDGKITHHKFYQITDFLNKNDVLVLNNTRVFPARFFAKKDTLQLRSRQIAGGGVVEVLLIEEVKTGVWKALTKPGLKVGQIITFKNLIFKVIGHDEQTVLLQTKTERIELLNVLEKYGHTPLPPYIHSNNTEQSLRRQYQTVYATTKGSVAAPTAGFHFTPELLQKIKNIGVQIEYVTLHVGLGTFAPVKSKNLEDHPMHYEYFELKKAVAERLNKAKNTGKRIIAVGTTTTRVLESCSSARVRPFQLVSQKGRTNLFIHPLYKFKFVDALITNFHLPKSTLLCLISAFVSSPNTDRKFKDFNSSLMGKAYAEAIKEKYRFYSFGDASFII